MVPHHAAPTETLRAPRKSARHYRGVLRSIADSVDGNFEAALDYVLVKHGTQDGSSYAPTQWSDARELDGMLGERDAHLRAPKGMSAEDATATLESIGAIDAMESRRAQLLADGYSASLARAPHYVTMTVSRDGQLAGAAHADNDSGFDDDAYLVRAGCLGRCNCDGLARDGQFRGFCSISLCLVVRGNGCVAAVTSPGAWGGFHIEEILVPEIFMAGGEGQRLTSIDERARLRYRDQITRIFARFLVLAFTAFDGRLVSYLREHQTRY